MGTRYRRYFDSSRGAEICLLAEAPGTGPPPRPPSLTLVVDKDDDEQVGQITLDTEDTRTLHRLLGEALSVMEGIGKATTAGSAGLRAAE